MTRPDPTPSKTVEPVVDTPTYRLLAQKLGQDPLAFIRDRRRRTPPVSFARIADELKELTGEYITHEIPRRWYTAWLEQQGTTDRAA